MSLSQLESDWRRLVSHEIFEVSDGNVVVHKSESIRTISLGLGKLQGDWGWFVSDKVLKVADGNVVVHKSKSVAAITLSLGQFECNWRRLVSDEILKVANGNVVVHKSESIRAISVDFGIKLDKTLSDWRVSVSNQVNKSLFGDIFTVELSNKGSWVDLLVLPVGNLVIWAVVSIIVWEALIKSLSQTLGTIIWVSKRWWGLLLWDSLDHHTNSDVVVVRWILLLISILLQDGVEGIISNNLSETLESNRFDSVKVVGWRNLESNSFDLINWNINWLGILVEVILSLSLDEVAGSWSRSVAHRGGVLGSLNKTLLMWLAVLVVVLLVSLFVMLLVLVAL